MSTVHATGEDATTATATALVVHESMFGNTAQLAVAVADGLGARGVRTTLGDVTTIDPVTTTDYDLVVLGAPTHAFSLSRPATRADAVRQGAPRAAGSPGMREWLAGVPERPEDQRPHPLMAAFDSRVSKVRRLPTNASRATAKQLRERGYRLAADPIGFLVADIPGPLLAGELDRARAWGASLAEAVVTVTR